MLLIDQDFLPQAQSLISTARSRIDISTFKAEINSKPRGRALRLFFEELFKKHEQGVSINFLLNWSTEKRVVPLTNSFVIHKLKQEKINVRILPDNRCSHAKILIVDQQVAIIGSHNLSIRSCHNNFEVSYIIQKPADLARLNAVFHRVLLNSKIP